jgi:dTMP kinase
MFITLEGSEGSGKTSQIPTLLEFLRQQNLPIYATREPGGTPISNAVREILMGMENKAMHARTEILLFCASRAQLVEEVIRPKLAAGEIVLCDRYADSTLAYQGYGRGVDLDWLRRLLDFATGSLQPDLTLLLDVDVEEGLRRKRSSREWNRLDAEEVAFYQKVRQGYLDMAAAEPQRWVVIDAGQPRPQVQQAMRQAILERLRKTP